MAKFLIIGAGSWGTAVALMLANNGHDIDLWSLEAEHRISMREERCNRQFLPNHPFAERINIVDDFISTADQHDHVIIAVPSHGFCSIIEQLPNLDKLIWISKGLDQHTGQLLSDIAYKKLGGKTKLALLTGPSFAKEVADGQPTAVVLACNDLNYGKELQQVIHAKYFRTYLCEDIIGAQLGGAVKNVMAIAVGIADGLNYGKNTQAMLITRGLAEMIRLGVAMGAKQSTFMGLSGLGDLVLTCSDNQSRNRRFGSLLGQGKTQEEAFEIVEQVVEGFQATELVYNLAQQYQVSMPITETMHKLLHQNGSPEAAVNELLSRDAAVE